MKGFNLNKMLKQAQDMQKKMDATQQELESLEITGAASSGIVSITLNGKNEFKSIKIKPEAINPENPESVDEETVEMLEDLITSAMRDANTKVNSLVQERMSSITGGLNINIPGLF